MSEWRPSASMAMLQKRAGLLAYIRAFFAARQVMEVDVPVIAAETVTEPNIDSLQVFFPGHSSRSGYLMTSPEFYMKRLLAAGSGPIYCLGHAFRADESGLRHHREFTMLEWYRPDWSTQMLAQEVSDLVAGVIGGQVRHATYREVFIKYTGIDPFQATTETLKLFACEKLSPAFVADDRGVWLDLLFSHVVEPQLCGLVFVTQFPAAQAALAQTETDVYGNAVANRFELYIDGMEIANGYQEELSANVLLERFEANRRSRTTQHKPVPEIDQKFIAAMSAGLPACAGVALGVDRLLMAICNEKNIAAVMPFME